MGKYDRSLRFWQMGEKYLHLTQVVAEQIIKKENQCIATWSDEKTDEESAKELIEQTKWSDVWLIEPLLFDFYHGLELLLKGFSLLKQEQYKTPNHKLTDLITFLTEKFPEERDLPSHLRKYLFIEEMPPPLRDFMKTNSLQIDSLHEALRYPYKKSMDGEYEYMMLKYRGSDGVSFFKDFYDDISVIMRCSAKLGKKNRPVQ